MYVPTQFRETRLDILERAIREIQLAALVTASSDGYAASHLPMVLKREGEHVVLEGHLARQNEHGGTLATPLPSLAIFQGPQAYVSPSWYPTKREHGRVVPTWNYIAVHAHGTLERVEDESWLVAHLDDLTDQNEAERAKPWAMADAPADFIRNLSRAVIGLRLRVERLEGAWKMIQHRGDGDRHGTIAGLEGSRKPSDHAVAEVMRGLEAARS